MKRKKYILRISLCILCLFCLASCTKKLDPEELFREYILDPIPKSVKKIKVDQTTIFHYSYLFGFDIEREDVDLIIDSKSLTITTVGYYDGRFHINNYGGYRMISPLVYGNRKRAKWFHPELWTYPDAYVYFKRIDHQDDYRILLFNEEENKAYFYAKRIRY